MAKRTLTHAQITQIGKNLDNYALVC